MRFHLPHLFRHHRMSKEREFMNGISDAIQGALGEVIVGIRRDPITVKHEVKRKVPIPRRATIVAENGRGQRYQQWIDLSYKESMRVQFPVEFFTERKEDLSIPPIQLTLFLDYDPADRN